MFEKLAGKFLSKILSQYFVSKGSSKGDSSSGTKDNIQNLNTNISSSVWSGYICLEQLELRQELVNDLLQTKGIGVEVLSCTLERVEITIPWAKLNAPPSSSGSGHDSRSKKSRKYNASPSAKATGAAGSSGSVAPGAVCVIVVDGVHILAKTKCFEYNDATLRRAAITDRRQELHDAELYGKDSASSSSSSSSYTAYFHKRLTEGLMQDILKKLHIQFRNVHVRLEDTMTVPGEPFAFGMTWENLHVQAQPSLNKKKSKKDKKKWGKAKKNKDGTLKEPALSSIDNPNQLLKDDGYIHKVAQLNHFSIYWNVLEDMLIANPAATNGRSVPEALTILHHTTRDPWQIAEALDRCIPRQKKVSLTAEGDGSNRGNTGAIVQQYSFLLCPVDAVCHVALSSTPKDLSVRPALVLKFQWGADDNEGDEDEEGGTVKSSQPVVKGGPITSTSSVSIQVRDFQYRQVLQWTHMLKEHQSMLPYRAYRPLLSIAQGGDTRQWWQYAIHVVCSELRKSRMRWSWSRFHERLRLRRRYCDLYERKLRFHPVPPSTSASSSAIVNPTRRGVTGRSARDGARAVGGSSSRSGTSTTSSMRRSNSRSTVSSSSTNLPALDEETSVASQSFVMVASGSAMLDSDAPDEGAGPQARKLTRNELNELVEMEDGVRGDLTIQDIVLYRALVKARLAGLTTSSSTSHLSTSSSSGKLRRSPLRRMMSSVVTDDIESEEEFERLMSYLEQSSWSQDDDTNSILGGGDDSSDRIAVVMDFELSKASVSFFAPLQSTTDLKQQLRLHERFFESSVYRFRVHTAVLEGYKSLSAEASLEDVIVKEIRTNRQEYVVVSRLLQQATESEIVDTIDAPPPPSSPPPASTARPPMWRATLIIDPPDSPEYDVGIHSELQGLQLLVTPSNEWLVRLDRLFGSQIVKTVTSSLKTDVFSVSKRSSSRASRRAGLLARAEAALSKHKNLDLDIMLQLPVIFVDDGLDLTLRVDLGVARFKTDRLAGLAVGKLSYALIRGSSDRSLLGDRQFRSMRSLSFDQAGTVSSGDGADALTAESGILMNTPGAFESKHMRELTSSRRFPDSYSFVKSTPGSISGRKFARKGSHMSVSETINVTLVDEEIAMKRVESGADSHLYDTFVIAVMDSNITLHTKSSDLVHEILSEVQMNALVAVSVVPSDTSICQFKVSSQVEQMQIVVSPDSILSLGMMTKAWQAALSGEPISPDFDFQFERRMKIRDELKPEYSAEESAMEKMSDDSSAIDENEFLDAVDGKNANQDEQHWMGSSWIADTESDIDGASQSSASGPRRKSRSVSDVSSISERSTRQFTGRPGNVYLNAENLAKLEEDKFEDDSDVESNDDSFHSALSAGGRLELVDALEEDIRRASGDLEALKRAVALNDAPGWDHVHLGDMRRRKKSNRVLVERCEAELRALRASRQELLDLMENTDHGPFSIDGAEKSADFSEIDDAQENLVSTRAKALIRARRNRTSAGVPTDEDVNVARARINREIIHFALSIDGISVTVQNLGDAKGDPASAEFSVEKVMVSALMRSNETKVSSSIDQALGSFLHRSRKRFIFIGGTDSRTINDILPTQYPQFLALTPPEEKLFRFAMERKHIRFTGESKASSSVIKIRFVVGDMEMSPSLESVQAIGKLLPPKRAKPDRALREIIRSYESEFRRECHRLMTKSVSSGIDVVGRFSSSRIRLLSSDEATIGAFVMSDLAVRVARVSPANQPRSKKLQAEFRLQNLQILEMQKLRGGAAVELCGRRDHYSPLLAVRCRLQEVSVNQQGGWVTGEGDMIPQPDRISTDSAYSFHGTAKMRSPQMFLSVDGLKALMIRYQELRSTLDVSRGILLNKGLRDSHLVPPLRWRFDLSVSLVSVTIPSGGEASLSETVPRNKAQFTFSTNQVLERVGHDKLLFRTGTNDIGFTRLGDGWPILSKTSFSFETRFTTEERNEIQNWALRLPDSSPWIQDADVLKDRSFIPDSPEMDSSGVEINMALAVAPMRISLSSSAFLLAIECVEYLKSYSRQNKQSPKPNPMYQIAQAAGVRCHMFLSQGELKLLQENQSSGGIAVADPLLSLSIARASLVCRITKRDSFVKAHLGDLNVYDMSSLPGIRVLGLASNANEKAGFASADFLVEGIDSDVPSLSATFWLGKTKCIVIPSGIHTLLEFAEKTKVVKKERAKDESTRGLSLTNVLHADLRFDVAGFELILSSRDLFEYIRDRREDNVSVVTFRWSMSMSAVFEKTKSDELAATNALSRFHPLSKNMVRVLIEFLEAHEARLPTDNHKFALGSLVELRVKGFQALRTSIRPAPQTVSGKVTSPYFFKVHRSVTGEQRITNPINFTLKHRISGVAWMSSSQTASSREVKLSQAISLESDFVDVLAYVNQSDGGMNRAFQVSILPVLASLKNRKSSTKNDSIVEKLKERLLGSTTICSLQVKGAQLTCVPGGATRLTESPIVKIAAKRIQMGLSAVQVPQIQTSVVPSDSESHLTVAAWINAEFSAHYHNRRLVAWEPVLESWDLTVRVGSDMVRVLNFPAMAIQFGSENENHGNRTLLPEGLPERAGETLRDFGRLLRAPFAGEGLLAKRSSVSKAFENISDLPFLLMVFLDRGLVASAVLTIQDKFRRSPPSLPSENPVGWLEQFGFPSYDESKFSTLPPLLCSINDKRPLNVNLTGALIENLAEFFGSNRASDIPHMIRNNSGLAMRFSEVLDQERRNLGETADSTILQDGSEIPLSLKRAKSQSCDPHRAFILIKLGLNEKKNVDDLKGDAFMFEVVGQISVDTVGVQRLSVRSRLDPLNKRDSVGSVIVRVVLQGGVKLVSIESPLQILNTSTVPLAFEVHSQGSVLWKSRYREGGQKAPSKSLPLPVPIHILDLIDDGTATLVAHGLSELLERVNYVDTMIDVPPRFSKSSIAIGIVQELTVSIMSDNNLNVCGLRIGSLPLERQRSLRGRNEENVKVPQQRLVLIRPPIVLKNHLPMPVQFFVRVKRTSTMLASVSSSNLMSMTGFSGTRRSRHGRVDETAEGWVDLGVIQCGHSVSWNGAQSFEKVEMKIQLRERTGEVARHFSSWSSPTTILSLEEIQESSPEKREITSSMKLVDNQGTSLAVSLDIKCGTGELDARTQDDIQEFVQCIPVAPMIVGVFVPYWIIDSTRKELEFRSETKIAGQRARVSDKEKLWDEEGRPLDDSFALGLGELVENESFIDSGVEPSVQIIMLGDGKSNTLSVRRNIVRTAMGDVNESYVSSWCEPMMLRSMTESDVYVPSPYGSYRQNHMLVASTIEPLALYAKMVEAPPQFGGALGTKLIHLFNRYEIVNHTGRDIEALSDTRGAISHVIPADGKPIPYHFDDNSPIRFRPTEFGWKWSGLIYATRKRREVTTRLVHRIKGWTLIITIEFFSTTSSPGTILVLRLNETPPFRLENHTMHPLSFGQTSLILQRGDTMEFSLESVILPYHAVDYAWDEPDETGRAISMDLADAPYSGIFGPSTRFGKFALERISPGSNLRFRNNKFFGKVVADGPTRVLQIFDANVHNAKDIKGNDFQHRNTFSKSSQPTTLPSFLDIALSHGIGVSVVDWSPQELVYVRLGEVTLERVVDGDHESLAFSISNVSVDNQLWITPYPVLLKMGRSPRSRSLDRIRRRRNDALLVSWKRRLSFQGDLTIFDRMELSVDPIQIRADGYLFEFLLEMAKDATGKGIPRPLKTKAKGTESFLEGLRVSGLSSELLSDDEQPLTRKESSSMSVYSAANASRAISSSQRHLQAVSKKDEHNESGKLITDMRHKFYVDKFRISTISTEVSWTGPLPLAFVQLPKMLRPALTFEALPVTLRPFAQAHTYGSIQDIGDELRSHYVNFWRVLDIVGGLAFRPTFLIRACFFTWRESLSSILEAVANRFVNLEKAFLLWAPREFLPIGNANETEDALIGASLAYKLTLGQFSLYAARWFRVASVLTGNMAASLQYAGGRESGDPLAVRSRDPRLFAHVDGNELLVEYVEGTNAGKALLSRVRRGQHLGEGYVFHLEEVVDRGQDSEQFEQKLPPVILMATGERVLLLDGEKGGSNFCSVLWEASFRNLVDVESEEESKHDVLKLWFMDGTSELTNRAAEAMAADADDGLDILLCKSFRVSVGSGSVFRSKIDEARKDLEMKNL